MRSCYSTVWLVMVISCVAPSTFGQLPCTTPINASSSSQVEPGDTGPATASCVAPQGSQTIQLSYELLFVDQISGSPFPSRTIQFIMRAGSSTSTLFQVNVPASPVLFATCTLVPFGSGIAQQCRQRFDQTLDISSLTGSGSVAIELFVHALTTATPPSDNDSASIDATLSIIPEQVSVRIQRPPSWAGNGDGSP
jgi:hypothetical protein